MKLVFAAGEFPPTLLQQGVKRIGSAIDADIGLSGPDILPQHCELQVTPQGVRLKIAPGAAVTVNQRPVDGLIALRTGDQIAFGGVQASLLALDAPRPAGATPSPDADDVGTTTVRAALPKYALRAQSGRILGRAPDCQLRLEDTSLSRKHAKLIPTNEGVVIEDLGSTNGSFHNGKRVQRAVALPGDEIGFDTVRFQLLELGQDAIGGAPVASAGAGAPRWVWLVAALVVVAIALAVLL